MVPGGEGSGVMGSTGILTRQDTHYLGFGLGGFEVCFRQLVFLDDAV